MTKTIVAFAIFERAWKMDILWKIHLWWQRDEEPTAQASQMIKQDWLRHTAAIIKLRELSLFTKNI